MVKRQQSRTRIPELCAISVNDIFVRITDLSKSVDFELLLLLVLLSLQHAQIIHNVFQGYGFHSM